MEENKVSIIHVAAHYPPHLGGAEQRIKELATKLVEKDIDVTVLTSNSETPTGTFTQDGVKVKYLRSWSFANTPIIPSIVWELLHIKKESLIHLHVAQAFLPETVAITAKLRGISYIAHVRCLIIPSSGFGRLLPFYNKHILARVYRGAKKVIVLTPDFVDILHKDFGVPLDRVVVIPNATTFKVLDKPKNTVHKPVRLLAVGRISVQKNYGFMLKVMEDLKKKHKLDFELKIVGPGEGIEDLKSEVKRLGIENNVVFTGEMGREKLEKLYEESDILIHTSLIEGFGTIFLEAMAKGLPIVASDVIGTRSVIKDGFNGFLSPLSVSKMSKSVMNIVNDKEFYVQVSKNNLMDVRKYDWFMVVRETINTYNYCLNPLIVQLSPYFPPHIGGMEVVAQEISKELDKQGLPVKVITSSFGAKNFKDNSKYPIERLNGIEFAHTPILWSLPFKLLFLPRKSILHVHLAQAGIPEITLLISKLRNFPFIAHFHLDIGPSGSFGILLPMYKKYILGIVLRRANKIIVFSDVQKDLVHKKYAVKLENIEIIPNGVGDEFFMTKPKSLPKEKLKILFVGRLAVQKRVNYLIEMLPYVKSPVALTIVGDGEDREKLENEVKKLRLKNISFEGRKGGEELRKYYREADIFAIASEREGMPLVVLEAMASGLPIIASDVLGLHELVKGTGILVHNPSPENFAREIDKLWERPEQLKKYSKLSSEKAMEQSWSKVVEKIKETYEEVQHENISD